MEDWQKNYSTHKWVGEDHYYNCDSCVFSYYHCSICGFRASFVDDILYTPTEIPLCEDVQIKNEKMKKIANTHDWKSDDYIYFKCSKCGLKAIKNSLGDPIVTLTCNEMIIANIIG